MEDARIESNKLEQVLAQALPFWMKLTDEQRREVLG